MPINLVEHAINSFAAFKRSRRQRKGSTAYTAMTSGSGSLQPQTLMEIFRGGNE